MTAPLPTRRHALLVLPMFGLSGQPFAAAAALPPALAELAMPGARLEQVQDPGEVSGKVYRTAGLLPNGGGELRAFPGTRLFDFRLPYQSETEARAKQVMDTFRHFDGLVRKRGGKRIDRADAPGSWFDVNARLFVYSLPTPQGELQFGLWIQAGDSAHWLLLFPAASPSAPPASSELAARLNAFGRAPVYINFDTGRAELKADGQRAVAEVVALLKADAGLKLSVEGHTDNVGDAAANRSLSLARAQAVRSALLAQGIADARLQAKGHGQEQPVADNRLDEGRARNRRVELVRLP